ncbi:hypothetical protein K8R47_00015 [archaeon]|nr:hypothetical protein [archaeon]
MKKVNRKNYEEVVNFLVDKSVKEEKKPEPYKVAEDVGNISELVDEATQKAVKLKYSKKEK